MEVDTSSRPVSAGAQFVVATHSPALVALPDACLHELDDAGVHPRSYDELLVVQLWRRFLTDPLRPSSSRSSTTTPSASYALGEATRLSDCALVEEPSSVGACEAAGCVA
jgi:hypothetical protein